MTTHFTADDGRRLAYCDSGGAGHPVLCLAGLSRNGRDFEGLARHLAGRYRVIRLDSRGRGGSEWAEEPIREYQVPVEAGDALALLRHLGIGRTAIVGTSRGGIVGMAIASGAPGLVSALILNDVGAVVQMAGLLRILANLGRCPADPDFDACAERLARENARQFRDVSHARWLEHAHAVYDDDGSGRPCLSYDPHLRAAVAALDEDMNEVSLWPMFEALGDVPVMVIRGENSDILAADTLNEMAEWRPDMVRLTVPDRGHAPFLDEAEAVAAIDAFLGEHAR